VHFAATIKTVAINRKNKVCAKYNIPAAKTEYEQDAPIIRRLQYIATYYDLINIDKLFMANVLGEELCRGVCQIPLTLL